MGSLWCGSARLRLLYYSATTIARAQESRSQWIHFFFAPPISYSLVSILQQGRKWIGYRRISLILYLFLQFLSDSDSNTDTLAYIYECGYLWLQIRIDLYLIPSKPIVVNIIYGYFCGYRVKTTLFTHITRVLTFEHPTRPNFKYIMLNKTNLQTICRV